jgi:sarcosine oxidase subunit gamma
MVDALARRPVAIGDTAWMRMLPAMGRMIMRGDVGAQSAAGACLGLRFSTAACRAATNGDRSALWLGPDEQLLLMPQNETADVAADLARVLAGQAYSLVDVSHRQVALQLHGPHAAWLLAAQCPLPLDGKSFPVGMCTRTVFSKAEIVLWRRATDVFHVEVWRSFAPYVAGLLSEVARELPG